MALLSGNEGDAHVQVVLKPLDSAGTHPFSLLVLRGSCQLSAATSSSSLVPISCPRPPRSGRGAGVCIKSSCSHVLPLWAHRAWFSFCAGFPIFSGPHQAWGKSCQTPQKSRFSTEGHSPAFPILTVELGVGAGAWAPGVRSCSV